MQKICGIYRVHENSDTIYDYMTYCLDKIMPFIDKLFILLNENLRENEYLKLTKYASNIYVHKNSDLIGDLQFIVFNHDTILSEYDELLYFDDSFFGPFFDLTAVFNKFDGSDAAFWGITQIAAIKNDKGVVIPKHIQPYFLVVKKSLFCSDDFRRLLNGHIKTALMEENFFTVYFQGLGYKWETYINTFESSEPEYNYDLLLYSAFDLIKKQQCPILAKKAFNAGKLWELQYNTGNQLQKAFDYIEACSGYDINLIWAYLLKNYNVAAIRHKLNLNYVIDSDGKEEILATHKKAAVFAHIYYQDLIDECFEYLQEIPCGIDVYVSVCDESAKEYIEEKFALLQRGNYYVIIAGRRGRDLAALLVNFKPFLKYYEYICFVHDKKTTGGTGPYIIGNSFMHMIWDNLLYGSNYINKVLNLFERHKSLGFLAPPLPYHSGYIRLLGDAWTTCYEGTKQLAEKLKLRINISEDEQPFALSTCFWSRTGALAALLDYEFTLDDFPEEPVPMDGSFNHALERILSYVAAYHGYYSAVLHNSKYAAANLTNFEFLLSKSVADFVKAFGLDNIVEIFSGFASTYRMRLLRFVLDNDKVCIYGQGNNGRMISDFLVSQNLEYEYFLVSDSLPINRESYDHRAYYFSEKLADKNKVGVIVALDKRFRNEVENVLLRAGWTNYHIAL